MKDLGLEEKLGREQADYVSEVYDAVEKIRDQHSSESMTLRRMYARKIKDGVAGLLKHVFSNKPYESNIDHPNPGFTIVLDWSDYVHKNYIENGVSFYEGYNYCGQDFSGKHIYENLERLMHADGAILVDNIRKISKVRGKIVPMKSEQMIAEKGLERKDILDQTLGYKETVDTRHIFAQLGSYSMAGTIIMTLSQGTGNIRIYRDGDILYSTLLGESPIEQPQLELEQPVLQEKFA